MVSQKDFETMEWVKKETSLTRWPIIKYVKKNGEILVTNQLKKDLASTSRTESQKEGKRKPDYLFYNTFPLEASDFYPFGKRPVINDSFYIGDTEAFSKKCRKIMIDVTYHSDAKISSDHPPKGPPKRLIVWEYYDGKTWKKLKVHESKLTFTCPVDINKTVVNNCESYWIRARLAVGDFGSEKYHVTETKEDSGKTTKFDYEIIYNNIKAPYVKSLSIESECKVFTEIQHYVTYNNLFYKEFVGKAVSFKLFELMDEQKSSFYLGLDKKIESGPISIYFDIESDYSVDIPPDPIDFYCYGNGWQKLDIEDNTNGFTRSGDIKILFPANFTSSNNFGYQLYWIKISHTNPSLIPRNIKGIFLNTSLAINSETISNEFIGSSNGQPDQEFKLNKSPLQESLVKVWIKEPALLDNQKRSELLKRNELSEVVDAEKNILEQWVLWHETDNLENSNPNDYHYELDRVTKKIRFGDGIHGAIPPYGFDNINVDYVTGGGNIGNTPENSITTLINSIPFVSSVNNPLPAQGGIDNETISHLLLRAPHSIKNRGQAITSDDYERLIQEYFPSISRSKCLSATDVSGSNKGGHVTVVAIPFSKEKKPYPNRVLLEQIEKMLQKRSSATIPSQNLRVIPPKYIVVSVKGDVYCSSIENIPILEKKVFDTLDEFFHPITGRKQGGWNFGELVCLSDVYRILQEIPDVESIENLSIVGKFDTSTNMVAFTIDDSKKIISDIPPHALICGGDHELTIKTRGIKFGEK